MSRHDEYARRTPYELAFPDDGRTDELIADLVEEAEARGVDPADRAAFSMLSVAGAFVHELQGPDAPAEAIHEYLALLYHTFHFVRAGRPVHLIDTRAARYLVGGAPQGPPPAAPDGAGYVQLPRHLFWVGGGSEQDAAAAPAEPVDGFFWTLGAEGVVHVLLATGMRDDRPGLAVVAVPEAPFAEAERWLTADVRPDGDDFATTLPGGDLEGLYSFTVAGEVLKLLARLFVYENAVPHAVQEREPEGGGAASEATGPGEVAPRPAAHGAPVPSRLPYKRVVLEG